MQRKNILFALAALGMLIGGVAVANAATGFLDNSTLAGGQACVDDDAETDTDTEVDDGPEDAEEADDCDGETDDDATEGAAGAETKK